jgi:hypothetical protein
MGEVRNHTSFYCASIASIRTMLSGVRTGLADAGSCWADAGQQAQQALWMSPASPASIADEPSKPGTGPSIRQMPARQIPDVSADNPRCPPDKFQMLAR